MSKPTVQAPATPDYAAANREGVMADIETLPLRNAINAASSLGTKYTDPNTGKTYDFSGLGSAEIGAQLLQQQLDFAPKNAEMALALQKQFGTDFVNESRRQAEAFDPTGFRLREQFGAQLANPDGGAEGLFKGIVAPQLGMAKDVPVYGDDAQTAAARQLLQTQVMDELSRVGTMDPALTRAAEQAARARGSNSGNLYGGAAGLNEALAVQLAQRSLDDTRRGNAMSFLQSGQSTGDAANRYKEGNFQNTMAALGFNNNVGQANMTNALTLAGAKGAAKQQDTANIQSYLGLTPVAQQAGFNQNAQQGAVPFLNSGYSATGTNANAGQAGANFASNTFGTQANIMSTQQQAASANSPLAMLGQLGGALSSFGSAYSSFGKAPCHVARLVYSEDSPQWVGFYLWKEAYAPAWFRKAYNRFSKPVAAMLAPLTFLHAPIRRWMDTKLQKV